MPCGTIGRCTGSDLEMVISGGSILRLEMRERDVRLLVMPEMRDNVDDGVHFSM
jgi:hypothetical protein